MSRIAQYLQEHLLGEVSTSMDVRRHLAHDASVLQMVPDLAVYPRDESDIRKTARFCWQLAERGKSIPITARGSGSDTSGAAIGSGIILLTTAHLNRILEFDPRKQEITVEPGIIYDKLEQTLFTHGLFLPPYPTSFQYSTLGGGLANNAIGPKSVKYGDTLKYVKSLRVVLANGEAIETKPLSKRELNHKMGLSSLEGEIYRTLDALLEESSELLGRLAAASRAQHQAVGYNLTAVRKKDHFDLTPLFIGSQGTLGIISEATLSVEKHNPETTMMLISLNSLDDLGVILSKILEMKPSMCDMVSQAALRQVTKLNPKQLASTPEPKSAALHLFVEFDDPKERGRSHHLKDLAKLVEKNDGYWISAEGIDDQQPLWKIRDSVTTLFTHPDGRRRAVPVAEDVAVPLDKLPEFLKGLDKILVANHLPAAWWGHAGSGVVRLHPQLDLEQLGDRQAYFKLSSSIYELAGSLGGSLSAAAGDGRTRAPFTAQFYGPEVAALMAAVKKIFDPHNILNPGVKFATTEDIKTAMHQGHSLAHRHEHLPRS